MICPSCGSDDIEVELDEETGIAHFDYCFNCGYEQHEVEYKTVPAKLRRGEFIIGRPSLPKLRLHNN